MLRFSYFLSALSASIHCRRRGSFVVIALLCDQIFVECRACFMATDRACFGSSPNHLSNAFTISCFSQYLKYLIMTSISSSTTFKMAKSVGKSVGKSVHKSTNLSPATKSPASMSRNSSNSSLYSLGGSNSGSRRMSKVCITSSSLRIYNNIYYILYSIIYIIYYIVLCILYILYYIITLIS